MSGAAVAVAVRRARKEIEDHFTSADATTPERAVPYDPDAQGWPRVRLRRRIFARLRAFDAIREPKPGLFYLDQARLAEYRASLRQRVLGLMALAAGVTAAAVALGG